MHLKNIHFSGWNVSKSNFEILLKNIGMRYKKVNKFYPIVLTEENKMIEV